MKLETMYRQLLEAVDDAGEVPCSNFPEFYFHPDDGGANTYLAERRIAKAFCNECPAKQLCGDYALAAGIRFGIWGGMSEGERRAILRTRTSGLAAAAERESLDEWLSA